MQTLLLDQSDWDVLVDTSGDIALASEPYAIAQDVASAIRTFKAEVFYDTTQGIPYFEQILGHAPPLEYVRAQMVAAALTVPGVVSAKCVIQSLTDRTLFGQVQFIDTTGASHNVTL